MKLMMKKAQDVIKWKSLSESVSFKTTNQTKNTELLNSQCMHIITSVLKMRQYQAFPAMYPSACFTWITYKWENYPNEQKTVWKSAVVGRKNCSARNLSILRNISCRLSPSLPSFLILLFHYTNIKVQFNFYNLRSPLHFTQRNFFPSIDNPVSVPIAKKNRKLFLLTISQMNEHEGTTEMKSDHFVNTFLIRVRKMNCCRYACYFRLISQ